MVAAGGLRHGAGFPVRQADAAFTPEGAEYVEHFCGLECYQRFQARASTATETSVKPDACDSPPSG
ncbi:DUF3330 domain-containing protein [Escherichia coli]